MDGDQINRRRFLAGTGAALGGFALATALEGKENAVLLLRLDPGIKMDTFFKISGEAKAAGFSKVHVAGEKEVLDAPTFQ